MVYGGEIPVVFENGVFRPETPVNLPERSRFRISIMAEADSAVAESRDGAGALADRLDALRARGLIRAGGWRPDRDELHERR